MSHGVERSNIRCPFPQPRRSTKQAFSCHTRMCVASVAVEDVHSKIHKPTTLYGDNQSALKLATNLVCHARTKNIKIEHHLIHEKMLDETIEVLEVRSNGNISDIFTKSLYKKPLEFLIGKLGVISRKPLKGKC